MSKRATDELRFCLDSNLDECLALLDTILETESPSEEPLVWFFYTSDEIKHVRMIMADGVLRETMECDSLERYPFPIQLGPFRIVLHGEGRLRSPPRFRSAALR